MNLGIDFGSTYTTISTYNDAQKQLKDICLHEGSPYIPSVVAAKGDEYYFGSSAKIQTGKKNISTFKAFKMMLPEFREENLAARGYSRVNTPQSIAERFLSYCMREALKRTGEEKIEHLIVGVPEVWNEQMNTMDGRNILKKICAKQDFVEQVQIVSEPAAASAFFAHNYQINTGKNFVGNILLIDYGGGTLDITLTNVQTQDSGAMEIKVEERTGAGENEQGEIGKAGVIFMESVMQKAIQESDLFPNGAARDAKFFKAVDDFEAMLKTSEQIIADEFDSYDLDNIEELDEVEFTTIEYRGEDISVSYGLMVRVYNQIIAPVLDEQLNQMIQYMEKHRIDYQDEDQDVFKIALVGGFGNFYLVNAQVQSKFRFSSTDKRKTDIICDASDREKAVAMGAALLASGVVSIRNTAPYSIGISTSSGNFDYAIRYKQDIEFDHPYFARGRMDGKPRVFLIGAPPESFVINRGEDDKTALEVSIKAEFIERMKELIRFADSQHMTAIIGFSLDSSGILSVHARPYDPYSRQIGEEDHYIVLDSFNNIFGMAEARPAGRNG